MTEKRPPSGRTAAFFRYWGRSIGPALRCFRRPSGLGGRTRGKTAYLQDGCHQTARSFSSASLIRSPARTISSVALAKEKRMLLTRVSP